MPNVPTHLKNLRLKISRLVPVKFKAKLKEWHNKLSPNESIIESKNKWQQLAQKNANYFVMSNFGEDITEEQFSQTGQSELTTSQQADEVYRDHTTPSNKVVCPW